MCLRIKLLGSALPQPCLHKNATTTVQRRGSSEDLTVPLMVHQYNGGMGGVDIADQYMIYYAIG